MRFQQVLDLIKATANYTGRYMTNAHLVSERHCYIRLQGQFQAMKLVNFRTKLEQDWVPSTDDMTRDDWQILED